mgnify:CR=1 FL=1
MVHQLQSTPRDDVETITLQVDDNMPFEALGVMFNDLEPNNPKGKTVHTVDEESTAHKRKDLIQESTSNEEEIEAHTITGTSLKSKRMFKKSKGRNRCDICNRHFRLASRLTHHRSVAHVGVYFSCTTDNCEKHYKTKDALALHHKMVGHSGMGLFDPNPKKTRKKVKSNLERNYTCEECNKMFLNIWDLAEHRENQHNVASVTSARILVPTTGTGQTQSPECGVCGKAFKNKALLKI